MKKAGRYNLSGVEIFGWYGFVAVLLAFVLLEFGRLSPHSSIYQFLNSTGSLGIFALALKKNDQPAAWLNFIWAAVALVIWFTWK